MLLLGLTALFAVISAFLAGICMTFYAKGNRPSFKKTPKPTERQAEERRRYREELENFFRYDGTILPPVERTDITAGEKRNKTRGQRVWGNRQYGEEEQK